MSDRIDLSSKDRDTDDRTRRYFGELYGRLKERPVLVVGAGAVGTEVVKNLVMLGVRNIHLVDFDKVAGSNLGRCVFFRPGDHGRTYKVDAVIRAVTECWPESRISAHRLAIQDAPDEIWEVPLVIVAVDNNEARYYINLRVLSCADIPFVINGATGRSFIEIQVLLPGTTACMLCSWGEEYFKRMFQTMARESCDQFFHKTAEHFPAISILNSLAGAIMAGEAVKILVGLPLWRKEGRWEPEHVPILGQCLRYDIRSHEFSVSPFRSNPACVELFCRHSR